MIKFRVFTIFPELFPQILATSIMGDALQKNLWQIEVINIRDYAVDNRKTIDDTPFGGGAGMLFRPDILSFAIEKNLTDPQNSKIIYPSPRGKLFNQDMARNLAKNTEINIICGRYEGIDQRVIELFNIEEISIGDYVLSSGELACYVMIDAILRNVENVLGAKTSLDEESFGSDENSPYRNLLEYPHYTRPAEFRGHKVPEVLISGHHQNIANWRLEKSLEITKNRRPDLYQKYLEMKQE